MRNKEHTMNSVNGAALDTPQDAMANGDGSDQDSVLFHEVGEGDTAAATRPLLPSQMFEFNGAQVRTVLRDDETWLVAADVCAVLGLTKTSQSTSRLDDDEKGVFNIATLGGSQRMIVINESGLYTLVQTSTKPEAKAFRRWVTHEVLPSIRRTGAYRTHSSAHQMLNLETGTFTIPGPGRYVILALPDGEVNVHQTEYATVIPELTAIHC